MSTQNIIFGETTQTLYLDPPEGQPTTVTSVEVFPAYTGDDSQEESATTGSASIDSVSTIVDANSGRSEADPAVVYVNDTTGIERDRDYLLIGSNGEREWVPVLEVDAGDAVISRVPLANDYVSGNQFLGTRISITVDSTWVANTSNITVGPEPGYRVRWEYVVDGTTCVRYTYFDLTRVSGAHNVRPIDIEMMVPGFLQSLPQYHRDDNGMGLIDESYNQLSIDLHEAGFDDDATRNQEIIDELVKRKAVVLWAEARALTGGDPASVEVARTAFDRRWNKLMKPSRIRMGVDVDGSGAGASVRRRGISVR